MHAIRTPGHSVVYEDTEHDPQVTGALFTAFESDAFKKCMNAKLYRAFATYACRVVDHRNISLITSAMKYRDKMEDALNDQDWHLLERAMKGILRVTTLTHYAKGMQRHIAHKRVHDMTVRKNEKEFCDDYVQLQDKIYNKLMHMYGTQEGSESRAR